MVDNFLPSTPDTRHPSLRHCFTAYTRILDHLAHSGNFGFHRNRKLLRRTADGFHARVEQALLHIRLVEESCDLSVQPVDDRPRGLKRGTLELPAQRHQPPGRELRIGAEAEVAKSGVRVPEYALQGIVVVDAVRPGHLVQRVHGFHA